VHVPPADDAAAGVDVDQVLDVSPVHPALAERSHVDVGDAEAPQTL
jgi:hypothetical protein